MQVYSVPKSKCELMIVLSLSLGVFVQFGNSILTIGSLFINCVFLFQKFGLELVSRKSNLWMVLIHLACKATSYLNFKMINSYFTRFLVSLFYHNKV